MLNKMKNILKDQLYPISLYARKIAGTVVLLLIARYLSVYDYGLFSSYGNIAGVLFLFANLGYSDWILVSSKAETKEVKLKISLFMLNAIVMLLFGLIASMFFNIENHIIFMLVTLRVFFDGTFFALILPYFQAAKKFNTIAIINIIYSIGVVFIAAISYILKLSLAKFLLLSIILGFINFIQCTIYIKISYLTVLFRIKEFFGYINKTIFDYVWVRIASILYVQIQPLYVSTFLKKEEAAIYFSAFAFSTIVNLFIASVQQKLLPEFVKMSDAEIKVKLKKNIFIIFLIIFAMFIFFAIFGKELLVLFYGKTYYANGYLILLILTISTIFSSIITINGTYITSSGNQLKKLRMQIETIFVALITLFAFSGLRIYGAVLSYLITLIYLAIRYYIFTNNLINMRIKGENKC